MDPVAGTIVVAAIAAVAQVVVALINHHAKTAGRKAQVRQMDRQPDQMRSAPSTKAPLIAAYASTATIVIAVLLQVLHWLGAF